MICFYVSKISSEAFKMLGFIIRICYIINVNAMKDTVEIVQRQCFL